jgi:pyridoxal phosphate enzyme (YggS family)
MYQNVLSEVNKYEATLVAVSKTKPVDQILSFYDMGQRDFGENKVQELVEKHEALPKDIRWHLIGSLQTNKVKYIVDFVHLIHSVDRMSLLKEINKQAKKVDCIVSILFQPKIAIEESKNGASEDELSKMIEAVKENRFPHVRLKGLMGMATFTDDKDQIANEFKSLKNKFDQIKVSLPESQSFDIISMGMSGDYKIALQEGSTMVRVGSLLFGSRD